MIHWKESFRLGIPMIDEQHKHLFDIILEELLSLRDHLNKYISFFFAVFYNHGKPKGAVALTNLYCDSSHFFALFSVGTRIRSYECDLDILHLLLIPLSFHT